jgi:hypothetical protein
MQFGMARESRLEAASHTGVGPADGCGIMVRYISSVEEQDIP